MPALRIFFVSILLLSLYPSGRGQSVEQATLATTGILDPSRSLDWTHAGCCWNPTTLTLNPIPYNRPACGATISPSGNTDITDANTINQRIQDCATSVVNNGAPAGANGVTCMPPPSGNGCTVQLGTGTFYDVNGLTFGGPVNSNGFTVAGNYITLKGMGPDKTKLIVLGLGMQDCGPGATGICINGTTQEGSTNPTFGYAGGCQWTAGYAKGSTTITIANCMTTTSTPGSMPLVNQQIFLDQRNEDIGLSSCSSSGGVATCVVAGIPDAAHLPPTFVAGACVGIGGVGNTGASNSPFGPSGGSGAPTWGLSAAGYNITTLSPQHPASPGAQSCTTSGGITAIGTDSVSGRPTISYNLCCGNTNLPTVYCGVTNAANAGSLPITLPSWAASTAFSLQSEIQANVGTTPYNYVATQAGTSGASAPVWPTAFASTVTDGGVVWQSLGTVSRWPCFATVDTGGMMLSGNSCVTAAGNCPSAGSASLGGGLANGRSCPDAYYTGASGRPMIPTCYTGETSFRSQQQVVTVKAITPSGCVATGATTCQITIDHPLYANTWRATQEPGVYWFKGSPSAFQHDDGIEALTVDALGDGGTSVNATIGIYKAYNCWIRNIRSIAGSRNHIWIQAGSSHITVRDSYFWGTKRGGTLSYGVEVFGLTSDVLVENNIFIRVVAALMNGGATGTVESYNYMNDPGYNPPTIVGGLMSANHDPSGFNLFEGNNSGTVGFDDVHGSPFGSITIFRSRARAQNNPYGTNGILWSTPVRLARGINFVGNVLGTNNLQTTTYQVRNTTATACNTVGYCLDSTSQTSNNLPDDHLVTDTIVRWGNYDVITGASRWCGTSGGNDCADSTNIAGAYPYLGANPIPANQTLPGSFYLAAGYTPGWFVTSFGTVPFPPVGPDVSGGDNLPTNCVGFYCGDDASGHSFMIPAQRVQQNMQLDSAYSSTAGNTVTSGTWASNLATLVGQFSAYRYETIQISGATPSGYNGLYQLYTTNGPSPANGSLSGTTGTMPAGSYAACWTYVRASDSTETTKSGCVRTGLGAAGGITVGAPTSSSNYIGTGSPCCAATGYNVYMANQNDPTQKYCKQNSSPIALGTNYVQSTPIIRGDGTGAAGTCVGPPLQNTAYSNSATVINQGTAGFPNAPSGPGASLTAPMPTITTQLIQVFNADTYYGTSTPPPTLPASMFTGSGKITGRGKLSLSTVVVSTAPPASPR